MTTPQRPRRRQQATQKPFHWFKGASVRALYDQIGAAGPDTARVEVRTEGDQMFFRVVADGEGANEVTPALHEPGHNDEINDSFICPPRCP